ncbi:MAG: hypothetical protein IPJ27_06740 [Candidatus Accumulibacter sp.]|uniref:Uncharacterized protein n=1 Tax=Candidatus Accumulibacter proximus TaxID=2954385 RepID=A0A935UF04_9PROT|nr:hypothetical protein [Candidatus Accumulibacter proximus]
MNWFTNQKIWVRLVATIWAMLFLLLSAMIIWAYVEQKANAETQAQDFAGSVHQMTMASPYRHDDHRFDRATRALP